MPNFMLLLNIISSLSAAPASQGISFIEILNHVSESEAQFLVNNGIDDWEGYANYLLDSPYLAANKGSNDDSGSVSDSITDIKSHLDNKYPDYDWIPDVPNSGLTSEVSGNIPVEMKSSDFPDKDIQKAIDAAGVRDKTSYGGCGPIALMGILDYFSRYLGYNEIIEDPTNSEQRIAMATEVLSLIHFSIFGGAENTLVWPTDYSECFDRFMYFHDMLETISSDSYLTLTGGMKEYFWNQIVENIDQGLPVTLFTGLASGDGSFSKHYTNIYGYETWIGIPENGGQRITKEFVKARLNWGWAGEFYCDADILDCAQVGIATYNVNYANSYSFYDHDFSQNFINEEGGGQYFFYSIYDEVTLPNGQLLETNRLRTSYIENEYLVLSPNRNDAGTAYLDIAFRHNIPKLSFSASMWSAKEGAINESFVIQYYDGGWKDRIEIDPYELSTSKNSPDTFDVLFPKDTYRIRFYATHSNPFGNRNKGRICLDNFNVEYND